MYFDDSFVPSDFVQIVGDYVDIEQLVEQPKIKILHHVLYQIIIFIYSTITAQNRQGVKSTFM